MSFNPLDFLEVAKELSKGSSEAHYRTSIGRSYYAVFGLIRNNTNSYLSDSPSVHQELISLYRRSPVENERMIASKLETLFKYRKQADYSHKKAVLDYYCNTSITLAQSIIDLFTLTKKK